MPEQPSTFGSELRRARQAAGLTVAELAARVHYSKGQISKVETGHKRPTDELGRLCDAELGADGALLSLLPGAGRTAPFGPHRTAPPGPARRQIVTAGAASVLAGTVTVLADTPAAASAGGGAPPLPPADGPLLDIHLALLAQYRRLGQSASPAAVLPALTEQTRALRRLAAASGPRTARELLALSARFAEFAGWMAQESGDRTAALRWTDHAVELADAAGDFDLASYALVRRGLVAYYRGDAAGTVALARQAHSGRAPARVRGLAAQREAQGHALAGDHGACMRSLDRARELLSRGGAGDTSAPVLGTTHLTDPVSMITGWSLLDLGRPREAAEALARELSRVPAGARRTLARYGTRQALAHALAGDLDQACALTADLLRTVRAVDSATVALDLRRLGRALGRHPAHPAVRELAPRLALALAPAVRP
ncbi:helix-turn-helix domain-containing protein [Streptomyces sp. NPDC021093]|uniref:helix-turn-helix domain-containing protein n=1 Tax=Streptomyces sp. NPDC021093 TaxID=3365112 RepID=UPI00379C5087